MRSSVSILAPCVASRRVVGKPGQLAVLVFRRPDTASDSLRARLAIMAPSTIARSCRAASITARADGFDCKVEVEVLKLVDTVHPRCLRFGNAVNWSYTVQLDAR